MKNITKRKRKDDNNENIETNCNEYSFHSRKILRTANYKRAVVAAVILALVLFGAGMKYGAYLNGRPVGDVAEAGSVVQVDSFENVAEATDFVVKIDGCVNKSGYFSISGDTTLRELVDYAGVTADGDLSSFDFSHQPQAGDVYYVKNKNNPVDVTPWLSNETAPAVSTDDETTAVSQPTGDKININTATLEQLKSLDGIGDVKAQAIIDYREKNGGFKRIEDIIAVKGIGDKTYANLKDKITVE